MKSKKAKEFIWYLDNKEQSTAATHAVKLAEKEMQEKAIEAFCRYMCPDDKYQDRLGVIKTCKECRDDKNCECLKMFKNQLNK